MSVNNFDKKEDAEALFAKIEDAASGFPAGGKILTVEAKPRKEPPPLLHDLSSLQQEANKRKGLTADQTLNILQGLYESKLVTYPRGRGAGTIGDDVFAGVPALIAKLTEHKDFGRQAEFLLTAAFEQEK